MIAISFGRADAKTEIDISGYIEVPAGQPVKLAMLVDPATANSQELAEVRNVELLAARSAGKKYMLSRYELARIFEDKLPSASELVFKIPAQITIEPVSNLISQQEIIEKILQVSAEGCRAPDCVTEIKNLEVPKIAYDRLVSSWNLDFSNVRKKGAVLIPMRLELNNGKIETSWVKALIEEKSLGWVAKKALRSNEPIMEQDLEKKWVNTTFRQGTLLADKEIAHRLVNRYVPAGEPVMYEDVKQEPDCNRGQTVQLVSGTENLEVSLQATAEESGVVGSTIKVKTLDTHKLLSAVVIDKGVVRLQ